MKLRLRGDSIRLRLTKSDVRSWTDAGFAEEVTHFPTGPAFRIRLAADAGATAIGAVFTAGVLQVTVPAAIVRDFAASAEVGLRAELPVETGGLVVMIEKDFPCMVDRPGEDDGDAFRPDELAPTPRAC